MYTLVLNNLLIFMYAECIKVFHTAKKYHSLSKSKTYISDGYTTKDVQYKWANQTHPVKKYKDITMAQFKLTRIEHGSHTMGRSHGNNAFLCYPFSKLCQYNIILSTKSILKYFKP